MIEDNPLAELPSDPGPHIQKIKQLERGEWLNLGSPSPDPKWGRARGVSWGAEALDPAPELRGAFRTGEGKHKYVKPNGFGQDDYWFYDINAHRWICLYPGTDTRRFNEFVQKGAIRVDARGRAVTSDGEPVPAHLHIHDWGRSSYNPDRKRFRFRAGGGFREYFFPGWEKVKDGVEQLRKQGLNKPNGGPFAPWAYNANTGRFERKVLKGRFHSDKLDVGPHPQFLYMQKEKKFFLGGKKAISLFDPEKRQWQKVLDQKGWGPRKYDFGGAYDSKRNHVYMGHYAMFRIAIRDGALESIKRIDLPDSVEIGTNDGAVTYDSVNDKVAIIPLRTGDTKVYTYDPEQGVWEKPVEFDNAFKKSFRERRRRGSVMFDPKLGVHFIFIANDSRDDGVMWVYRP